MQQEAIPKNPMQSAPMIKKANFFAAQDKENLPIPETVTIFTPGEIERFKAEAFKRDVPLNSTAVAIIEELRREAYFGENTPLICDETGRFTSPMNFRKRYYRILDGAGLEKRGLHSLRHTFASTASRTGLRCRCVASVPLMFVSYKLNNSLFLSTFADFYGIIDNGLLYMP